MHIRLLAAAFMGVALPAFAADDVQTVAEQYLKAISGEGSEAGKELLLGGATMNAQLFTLENWKIVSKEPVRKEEGDLAKASQLVEELDKAARKALTKLMGASGAGDDLSVEEVSQAEASKLMAPTKERAAKLSSTYPALAYVARVGKEVYWHPKNPFRALMAKAGKSGKYQLELHLWKIETVEGPRKTARVWPLRILRFKSKALDTGWKILPASDWNAE